jgi:hypothetical protein
MPEVNDPDNTGYALPDPPQASDIPGLEIPDGASVDALVANDGPHDAESWAEEVAARIEAQRIERLAAMGLPAKAVCGFVVVLNESGLWGYTTNIAGAKDVLFDREANQADVWHGGETVSEDAQFALLLNNVVQNVMLNMDQRMAMAQEQMKNLQVAQQAGLMDAMGNPVGNRAQRRHPGH